MLGVGGYVMVEVKKYSVSFLLKVVRVRSVMNMNDPGVFFDQFKIFISGCN